MKCVACTKSELASQFTATTTANLKESGGEWGMPDKPSLTSGCHNKQLTSLVCESVGVCAEKGV